MLWRGNLCARRSSNPRFLVVGVTIILVILYLKCKSRLDEAAPSSGQPSRHFSNHEFRPDATVGSVDAEKSAHYESLVNAIYAKHRSGLGDNGAAVELEGSSKTIGDKQLKKIALNEELSELIPFNRTLSDVRNPLCRDLEYDLDDLPTTSVVIIFFNEPFSVLVRTVFSVLSTGDPRILKEVILVDDFSSNKELKGQLDHFVAHRLPAKVKIIRLKSR